MYKMDLLARLLQKRGIKEEGDLDHEERSTFEQWRKTLVEEPVTIETLKSFCDYQLSAITQQLKDLDRSPQKTDRLVLLFNVYSSLRGVIDSPKEAKEALVRYLTSQL